MRGLVTIRTTAERTWGVHAHAFDRRQAIGEPLADVIAGRVTIGPVRGHQHVDVGDQHDAGSGSERRGVVTEDLR